LYRFPIVHTIQYRFLPQMVPLLLLNPHTFHPHIQKVHKIFHPHLLLVLKKTEKLASPHPQETPNIPSPPPCPPPPPPSPPHETTKPTPPNGSAQNNHAKAGTSGPNTSVICPGETPPTARKQAQETFFSHLKAAGKGN
jgi:hypothetical protein